MLNISRIHAIQFDMKALATTEPDISWLTKYLQCQNRVCWWNWSGPQTPPATAHSLHQHQVSTLEPRSHSHRLVPGSGLLGDTGHSTQMKDVEEPSGPSQEASPHSTLWSARKTMETLFCREEMGSVLIKYRSRRKNTLRHWGDTTPPRGDGKNTTHDRNDYVFNAAERNLLDSSIRWGRQKAVIIIGPAEIIDYFKMAAEGS